MAVVVQGKPLSVFLQDTLPELRSKIEEYLNMLGMKPEDVGRWELCSKRAGTCEFTIFFDEKSSCGTTIYCACIR